MAAGLGFKDFVTGEVLTAADVDGYLMQGIWVFASNAARNAAVTAPAEGNFAFTKDTNSLWYYDGAAWVASGATGDIEGVTAGVGISGGGTSGTVTVTNSMATAITTAGDTLYGTGSGTFSRLGIGTAGQVLKVNSGATAPEWGAAGGASGLTLVKQQTIGTSVTSVSVTNAFSSTYDNYLMILGGGSATNQGSITMQLGATTTGYYVAGFYQLFGSTTPALNGFGVVNGSTWNIGYQASTGMGCVCVIDSPNLANGTMMSATLVQFGTSAAASQYQGFLNNTTSYTGFTLGFEYAQTGGEIRVYGYQNS
jgi:hypothetical protein